MTVKTYIVDETEIQARDAKDLVAQMAASSRAPADTPEAWMEDAAARYRMMSGLDVRDDSAANFIEDLIAFKMIAVKE